MTSFLENLGIGALFAAIALPLLAASVGDVSNRDPQSRHGVLLWPMLFAASLFAIPWLRSAFRVSSEVEVPRVVAELTGAASGGEASRSWPEVLGVVFVGLVAMAAIRHVIRWARLQRVLVRSGLPSESVRAQVEQMAQVLGVAAPRVLVSHQTAAPFVVGALRPALVWPSALLESLSPPEQQLVVQHELSHLARGDHRLAPLLSLLQLAFPFHPTAKRLMLELAVAREEAVDARIDHEQLHVYAQLLVTVTAHANLKPRQLEVLGMADTSLQRRIAALTHAAPRPLARFGRVAVLGVAMISALVFAPQAIAQTSGHVLSLAVGEAKTLRVPNARRVAVGDPTVCDLESLPDGALRVVGVAPGSTTVLVWAGAEGQQTTYMCSVAQKK